jgi:hypothetical protein
MHCSVSKWGPVEDSCKRGTECPLAIEPYWWCSCCPETDTSSMHWDQLVSFTRLGQNPVSETICFEEKTGLG